MVPIKSYTDTNQSRELVKILPLESADMYYPIEGALPKFGVTLSILNIPCWSLAALLRIIPKQIKHFNTLQIDIKEKGFFIWYDYSDCGVNPELPHITKECAVDACVEMIIKLKEMNLL